MKSLVFTTLVGTAMINVPIWNREEKRKRKEGEQWKISFTKNERKTIDKDTERIRIEEATQL